MSEQFDDPRVIAPPAPEATALVAPPALPVRAGIATYEGMEQDTETGEAICNGIRTGWFFERPKQVVPAPDNPETGLQRVEVTPWAFATASTAQRVLEAIWRHTLMPCELFHGDPNEHFPISAPMRHIGVQGQPRRVAVNAGLIASQIARTTARLGDGLGGFKIVQNQNAAIGQAIFALLREIEDVQEVE